MPSAATPATRAEASMPHRFSVSAVIDAPPRRVYGIIADYDDAHARIIPKPPFVALDVEQGGRGAGTVIRVQVRLLGRVQSYRATVTEPQPGRVLAETNENGYVTTFTVEPRAGGRQAHVTIATETHRAGPLGSLETWIMGRLLRGVYLKELELLATVAASHTD